MADITVTEADVNAGSQGTTKKSVKFGETITGGQPVYRASDGKVLKCISTSEAAAACIGIVIAGGSDEQDGAILTSGEIDIGGTVVIGESYFVSGSSGGIQPSGDVGSSEWTTLLGIGVSSSNILIQILKGGVQHA